MPANLPPQYYELEREYKAERDIREKLRLAQELLRMMPKHKGTDKLQADMKAKISKLKKQIDGSGKSHSASGASQHDNITKEGAGQLILIGAPNCGKSSILDTLTHAKPIIADYPYTTREPLTGMVSFETIQMQLIDTPPISDESYEGYMSGLIRNADVVLHIVDLTDPNMLETVKRIHSFLEEKRIYLSPTIKTDVEDIRMVYKKTLLVGHKCFDEGAEQNLELLKSYFPDFKIIPSSIIDDESMTLLIKEMFAMLNVIRVYTKQIGKEVDKNDPVVLHYNATVEEAATEIHKDFGQKLKFAKVWGTDKFDGQKVHKDFVLADEDIIEFHL